MTAVRKPYSEGLLKHDKTGQNIMHRGLFSCSTTIRSFKPSLQPQDSAERKGTTSQIVSSFIKGGIIMYSDSASNSWGTSNRALDNEGTLERSNKHKPNRQKNPYHDLPHMPPNTILGRHVAWSSYQGRNRSRQCLQIQIVILWSFWNCELAREGFRSGLTCNYNTYRMTYNLKSCR
jgi:hypothetical protein